MLRFKVRNRFSAPLLIALFVAPITYAQRPISVAGVVVDGKNKPINGALVGFDFPAPRVEPDFGHDVATPGTISSRDGSFFLSFDTIRDAVWLVIETPVPDGLSRAIDQIDLKRFPEFRGLKLRVRKDPRFVYQLEY